MEREEIVQKIKDVIVDQIAADEAELNENTSFTEDLEADSLDMLQIITAIEDVFEIEVDDSTFSEIQTIGDAAGYIQQAL